MTCKEICLCHKGFGRYSIGHKRSQIFDLFMQWDGIFCPCCGSILRIGPRNIKNKAKLRKQKRYENLKNKKRIMLSIQSTTDDQFQVHADNIICNWFLNIVNTIIIN